MDTSDKAEPMKVGLGFSTSAPESRLNPFVDVLEKQGAGQDFVVHL